MNKSQNIKIWITTLTKLRMIYALTGESMVKIIDRLVGEELKKVEEKKK
jgi:hypothetical protein